MTVREISTADLNAFEKLFCNYYSELDCEDDPLHLFQEYVEPDLKAELFRVGVAPADGDEIIGFVIFQIDDVINDWNFKEGCGDVREIYVAPAHRKKGLGRALLQYAEAELIKSGAEEIYTLPVEESEKFFLKCGYSDTGEYCAEADNKVFGKNC
ncbi:MAG: GNAT family N-acetyltransferase [Clostridia bacterium]|nr:GNAT family N-acetyltransferase [Clostridia bacterium]